MLSVFQKDYNAAIAAMWWLQAETIPWTASKTFTLIIYKPNKKKQLYFYIFLVSFNKALNFFKDKKRETKHSWTFFNKNSATDNYTFH